MRASARTAGWRGGRVQACRTQIPCDRRIAQARRRRQRPVDRPCLTKKSDSAGQLHTRPASPRPHFPRPMPPTTAGHHGQDNDRSTIPAPSARRGGAVFAQCLSKGAMSRRRHGKKRRRGEEEKRTGNIEQCVSPCPLGASASSRERLLTVPLREASLAASQRVSRSFRGRTPTSARSAVATINQASSIAITTTACAA